MAKKKKLKLKSKVIMPLIVVLLLLIVSVGAIIYFYKNGLSNNLVIELNGKKEVEIEYEAEYKDLGASASYKDIKIDEIKKTGKVDTTKLGTYTITYNVKYKKTSKNIKRIVKVVDKTAPVITLTGDIINVIVGGEYQEPGYTAIDNYDKDISDKVVVTNNIDNTKIGEYIVTYKVVDSSNNEITIDRKVNVIAKPSGDQKIAVLNYHFFCDASKGVACSDDNFKTTDDFRKELNYLRDNNYKALTMKEFRDWMYGVIELPEHSVLITIDDGGQGTGTNTSNLLIPILEEYKMHATLFLITGWWDKSYYVSDYLDVESHTNDMHNEKWCEGVTRGARMLCQTDEQVLTDLKKSIDTLGTSLGFCFPFYAYDDRTINLVKQAGFDLAFIGGGYKASRATDKYHIPRYQVKRTTSLDTFIGMVS